MPEEDTGRATIIVMEQPLLIWIAVRSIVERVLSTPMRRMCALAAAYGVVMAALLPLLSLWLDEVLYLFPTREGRVQDVIAYAARNAGGVPLGYLFSFFTVKLLGFSAFAGRLPSLLFSLAAGFGVFQLARRLNIQHPVVAAAIFLAFPLQVRYAMEARPYSAALCLSIWSTVAFFWVQDKPSAGRALVYGLLVETGIYLQPYSLFVPFAHAAWLVLNRQTARRLVLPTIAVCAAGFIPWYLYSRPLWNSRDAAYAPAAELGFKTVQLLIKEMVGLGYPGTLLVLTIAAFGLIRLAGKDRQLMCLYFAVPVAGALTANLAFGYFLAIRQVIFLLAPLALLSAGGLQEMAARRPPVSKAFASALLLACLYGNLAFVLRTRENWAQAAAKMAEFGPDKTCLLALPAGSLPLYSFFRPELAGRVCDAVPARHLAVVVAVSPYEPPGSYQTLEAHLGRIGRMKAGEQTFGGPRVVVFVPLLNR